MQVPLSLLRALNPELGARLWGGGGGGAGVKDGDVLPADTHVCLVPGAAAAVAAVSGGSKSI
jgi:hypothetical protein